MQGYQYNKTTSDFIADVPNWDGEQPTDGSGITGINPMDSAPDGRYIHRFDELSQSWIEGDPDAAVKRAEAEAARLKAAIDNEAQARIIAELPQGNPSNFLIKEINLLAGVSSRLFVIIDKLIAASGLDPVVVAPELSALSNNATLWARIEQLRDIANEAEAAGVPVDQIIWPT